MLRYAVKGRVPLIAVQLEDTVYTADVLAELTGEKVWHELEGMGLQKGHCYFKVSRTGSGPENPVALYKTFKDAECTLVYTNLQRIPPEFLDAGVVSPPQKMIKTVLSGVISGDVDGFAQAVGGMSVKDVITVATITHARDEKLTPAGLVKTRRALLKTARGLTLVDPYMPAYKPHTQLETYVQRNRAPFLKWHDTRLRPKGLLFKGKPGTGKTMGAKYIAREWGVPLFRIDSGFQSKWHSESENFFAAALKRAEEAAPAVLLIDEAEKYFAGQKTDNLGVTARVMGNLLWWLQESEARVLTIMTTNDEALLPPELYREGRIDEAMEFPLLMKEEILEVATVVWNSYADGPLPDTLKHRFSEAIPEKQDKQVSGIKFKASNPDYGKGVSHTHVAKVVRDFVAQIQLTKEGHHGS